MRLVMLEVRLPGVEEPARAELPAGAAGVFPVPSSMGDAALADLLHVALDGAAPDLLAPGARVHLVLESDGERFRVERGAGGEARLVRETGAEEELLAEGDPVVTDFLMRLAGAWEPLGRRAVVRLASMRRLLGGRAPGASLHDALAERVEPLAQVLGARMRELLQRAHLVLRDTTETLAPGRDASLQPEDLGALREAIVSRLTAAFASLARLEETDAVAAEFAERVRARHDRVRGLVDAERLAQTLEKRRHMAAASRSRLERAHAAKKLRRPERDETDPAARERAARQECEQVFAAAREALEEARRAHDAEASRAAEREAAAAWHERVSSLPAALSRLEALARQAESREARVAEVERALHESTTQVGEAVAARDHARRSLELAQASPEQADQFREEAAHAMRLRDEVARVQVARERLRDKARDVQVAKLAAGQAAADLEAAQREHEWRARSPHPTDQPLPALPPMVKRRDEALRQVAAETEALAAVREHLRQVTSGLGAMAYIPLPLLDAEAREKQEQAARFGGAGLSRAQLEASLEPLEIAADRAEQLGRALRAQLDEAVAELVGVKRDLAAAEDEVPAALRDTSALRAAIEHARRERDERRAAWAAAESGLRVAKEQHDEAARALRVARDREEAASSRISVPDHEGTLNAAGFSSWDEVERAALPEHEMTRLQEEVSEVDELERTVEEGRRRAHDEAHVPSLEPAQADRLLAVLRHAMDGAQARRDALTAQLEHVDAALDALDEISANLETIEVTAGLAGAGERGATFEDRIRESLLRLLLARAEGRLARWQRPWSLEWEDRAGRRRLAARDAESGAPIAAAQIASSAPLALALALEAALIAEGARPMPSLVLDADLAEWPAPDAAVLMTALNDISTSSRAIGLPGWRRP